METLGVRANLGASRARHFGGFKWVTKTKKTDPYLLVLCSSELT